ncbi:MAG: lycopene cyclase family protein [Flavobacteriaceae bacterium]|nr:lycopene cyclase family protein [Flavobacteriaceae bacterium]
MSKTAKYHFDYIIIGNGLVGLQLALKFSSDPYFSDKKFALIDPSQKDANDKTWCFWENGHGNWDHLVSRSWNSLKFVGPSKEVHHNISPYNYKMVRSIDFYKYAKTELVKKSNFTFFLESVTEVKEFDEYVLVETESTKFETAHVFDSRIPEEYLHDTTSTKLIQHFKGWVIETKEKSFDSSEFTVMDYRNSFPNTTSFFYILPFSDDRALIEFTFFNHYLIPDAQYDDYLNKYISNVLEINKFEIIENEIGQIPMTDFNFSRFNTERITKIGTGGGWVKGSTGYSFKLTESKVEKIISNLKREQNPSKDLFNKKYSFYDSIFLKVLSDNNHKGPSIFEKFYDKNKPKDYLPFLNEESSFFQDIKIMYSLFSPKFIKALFS